MHIVYFFLYLFAGVCFGLAAGRYDVRRIDFLSAGLFLWVTVSIIKTFPNI
jgi:hypothetical protein